jgi:hypothetical protein
MNQRLRDALVPTMHVGGEPHNPDHASALDIWRADSWPIAFGHDGGLPVSQTHRNRRPTLLGQRAELVRQ